MNIQITRFYYPGESIGPGAKIESREITTNTLRDDNQGGISMEAEYNDGDIKAREVRIIPFDYGYQIRVGCQILAIENLNVLVRNLEAYLSDPAGYEKRWNKTKKLL